MKESIQRGFADLQATKSAFSVSHAELGGAFFMAPRSLLEPLQVAMANGARWVLTPAENKRGFLAINTAVIDKIDPIFFYEARCGRFPRPRPAQPAA